MAIEPKTKADQDKMGMALQRLAEEDPTFRVKTDEETGQTLISGMGELHLEIIVDRMMREFKVDANVGKPQVAYRETIRRAAEGKAASSARPAASGQYGHAVIKLEPGETGSGLRVRRQDHRRHHPARVHQARRRRASARRSRPGVYAGYPMVDVKATLFDGSFHEVDSSEMAFKIAGSMAFKDAVQQGRSGHPGADHEGRGDHARGVHGRRHRRPQHPPRPHRGHGATRRRHRRSCAPSCRWPRCSATPPTCGRMTQGRATYSMEFSHYAEVPQAIANELVQKSRAKLTTSSPSATQQL